MARKIAASRYVAFLRGINLGKRRVKMEDLRDHFAALGFANVATYIASGNVIFDAPAGDPAAIEARIEAHLVSMLGYEVETFLRTPAELAAVAAFRPFAAEELEAPDHTLHVGFLRGAVGDEVERAMLSFRTAMDDFRFHGRELYWLCRGKTTDSLVSWPKVAKAVRMPSTMRNVTTIRKLSAKYPPG
jgi:uncharacterized protein (DUF1697 family)